VIDRTGDAAAVRGAGRRRTSGDAPRRPRSLARTRPRLWSVVVTVVAIALTSACVGAAPTKPPPPPPPPPAPPPPPPPDRPWPPNQSFAGPACLDNPGVTDRVACENTAAGNDASEWDISGSGDPSIQGFATSISVNRGETVHFKVDTNASLYHFEIYRLGYYGGAGARKVAVVRPTAALPQIPTGLRVHARRQPGRLRELVRIRDLGRPSQRRIRDLPRQARPRLRRFRIEPHRLHRAGRCELVSPSVPDVRRDMAGLQQLRRLQLLRGRRWR